MLVHGPGRKAELHLQVCGGRCEPSLHPGGLSASCGVLRTQSPCFLAPGKPGTSLSCALAPTESLDSKNPLALALTVPRPGQGSPLSGLGVSVPDDEAGRGSLALAGPGVLASIVQVWPLTSHLSLRGTAVSQTDGSDPSPSLQTGAGLHFLLLSPQALALKAGSPGRQQQHHPGAC